MDGTLPSYEDASLLVADYAAERLFQRPPTETVGLSAAMGRILARTLHADRDPPPFPRSTRDGFACRAAEASTHMLLDIAGSSRAGSAPAGPLPPGGAWEIMTGAPVPIGADAVMMVEHAEVESGQVWLLPPRTLALGENVVAQGAQAQTGDPLLAAGTPIHFAQVALAATCGYDALEVFARPRVAILTTGDELVPVDSAPAPGQIRNSNAPMLAALVSAAGGEPWVLPTAADTDESLDRLFALAAGADMLLISGGVSAGKFDLVEPALARAGGTFHFTGVHIQPGKPLVFGELPRKGSSGEAAPVPLFGLPGNPVSTAVTFLLFGQPVLGALAGSLTPGPRFALARLASAAHQHGKKGLTRFLPASCTFGEGSELPDVVCVSTQGSGDVAALALSNCFICVPEGVHRFEQDEIVRILLMP
jgi:molybdopterin molybdotransferase